MAPVAPVQRLAPAPSHFTAPVTLPTQTPSQTVLPEPRLSMAGRPAPWGQGPLAAPVAEAGGLPAASPFPQSHRPAREYEPTKSGGGAGSFLGFAITTLVILGGIGAGVYYFFLSKDGGLKWDESPPAPLEELLGEEAAPKEKAVPQPPVSSGGEAATTPVVPPVGEPLPPLTETPPETGAPVVPPADAATPPVTETPPETTVPPEPVEPMEEPEPTPGAIKPADVVPEETKDNRLHPVPEEALVKEFQTRLDAFFKARTPEERLPLMFSETQDDAALADATAKGTLGKLPELEYKALIAFDGPREGISQYYVAATNKALADEDENKELLLHLANHGAKPFRINADALRFQVENQLRAFAENPGSGPLRAYVFLERAHYIGTAVAETPKGHICVNLRYGPYTPVVCQAFVDLGTAAGLDLSPLAIWSDAPKAAVLTLAHGKVAGAPAIVVDAFHCGNWLVAYPKEKPPEQ